VLTRANCLQERNQHENRYPWENISESGRHCGTVGSLKFACNAEKIDQAETQHLESESLSLSPPRGNAIGTKVICKFSGNAYPEVEVRSEYCR